MAAVTGAELSTSVAARLKMAEAELPDYWGTICDEAATAALVDVQAIFQKRGYTAAQVNAADSINHWTKTLGLYWALLHGGAYSGFEAETLKGLDIRKSLENTPMIASGLFVSPTLANAQTGTGSPSPIGTGTVQGFDWPDGDGQFSSGDGFRW
jgi:hypothetical protein